jgi:uncharacterized membrane protein YqjE
VLDTSVAVAVVVLWTTLVLMEASVVEATVVTDSLRLVAVQLVMLILAAVAVVWLETLRPEQEGLEVLVL